MLDEAKLKNGNAAEATNIVLGKWHSYRLNKLCSVFGETNEQVIVALLSQPFVINPKQAIEAYSKLIEEGLLDVSKID